MQNPVALIILDGWGIRAETHGNAVALARKPVFDRLWSSFPTTTLQASGPSVGLPEGQMGNSEVGHMNLGAGRIVKQDLVRISESIATGSFFQNTVLTEHFQQAAGRPRSTLHILGLLSDGGVHSHLDHLLALVKLAKQCGVQHCFVHAFLDGRDTGPKSAKEFLPRFEAGLRSLSYGTIASVGGRFFAMDRDKRWDRVQKSYEAIVHAKGPLFPTATAALEAAYVRGETDEFVTPSVICTAAGNPIAKIQEGDGIFFGNFRPDRCRELVEALSNRGFSPFPTTLHATKETLATMTRYREDYPFSVAFEPQDLSCPFGEVVSRAGLPQLRAAETEKFPHVTYFFNCGRDDAFSGEERILVPSPRDVKTYDERPSMSAPALADAVVNALSKTAFPFFLLNFANPDMVGHTGVLQAAVNAVETVDECLGKVLQALHARGGTALVTADHGNCEMMIQPDGTPHTAHTTNPVPLILVDESRKGTALRSGGVLADIAPTLVEMMGLRDTPHFQDVRSLFTGVNLLPR